MKRAGPSKKFFRPYVKKLKKFSCAPFGLVQPFCRAARARPQQEYFRPARDQGYGQPGRP
jgi:hypothetical protein